MDCGFHYSLVLSLFSVFSSFKAPFSDMLHQVELEQYISHIDQQRDKSFIMSGTKGRYDIENTKVNFVFGFILISL